MADNKREYKFRFPWEEYPDISDSDSGWYTPLVGTPLENDYVVYPWEDKPKDPYRHSVKFSPKPQEAPGITDWLGQEISNVWDNYLYPGALTAGIFLGDLYDSFNKESENTDPRFKNGHVSPEYQKEIDKLKFPQQASWFTNPFAKKKDDSEKYWQKKYMETLKYPKKYTNAGLDALKYPEWATEAQVDEATNKVNARRAQIKAMEDQIKEAELLKQQAAQQAQLIAANQQAIAAKQNMPAVYTDTPTYVGYTPEEIAADIAENQAYLGEIERESPIIGGADQSITASLANAIMNGKINVLGRSNRQKFFEDLGIGASQYEAIQKYINDQYKKLRR